MVVSLCIVFLGYALIALSPTGAFWLIGTVGLIAAFCVPIVNVLAATITQTIIPLDMQGRVNSVNLALVTAATPIGMIASGAIVAFVSTSYLFLGCAITGIVAVTLAWLFTDFRHVETI
jgi:MFS family permease